MPEFKNISDGFQVTVFAADESAITENISDAVEKTVEKILNIIANNPRITQAELAEMTGLTRRGIEWNLSKLKAEGLIERVGADKGGYWKIKEEE